MNLKDKLRGAAGSYHIINIIFGGVIIMIIVYSAVFSPDNNNYPIQCIHEQITGLPCPSCGLSHSLSLIIRGDFELASQWNQYGLRIFLFFVFQLILRISTSISLLRLKKSSKELVLFDITATIASFIISFGQFAVYYFRALL